MGGRNRTTTSNIRDDELMRHRLVNQCQLPASENDPYDQIKTSGIREEVLSSLVGTSLEAGVA